MKISQDWSPSELGRELLRTASSGPNGSAGTYGRSVAGAALRFFALGRGRRRLLLTAAHHANEWITAPLLLRFAGELASGPLFENARRIAEKYPDIPFPDGWKANLRGVDLNLQYPAGWGEAKKIKFAAGWTGPAPRDYVGAAPLCAPEARALYRLTRRISPELVIALHTQGEVIYWKYLDLEPPGAEACGRAMADASGYALEDTPYASGHAGYKDWFILDYDRPGYTIECGLGENPLPWADFGAIYPAVRAALAAAVLGC